MNNNYRGDPSKMYIFKFQSRGNLSFQPIAIESTNLRDAWEKFIQYLMDGSNPLLSRCWHIEVIVTESHLIPSDPNKAQGP